MKRLLLLSILVIATGPSHAQRLKDVAGVQGARGNQLVGFGLVVGLEGTGDSTGAAFTPQAIANALQRLGTSIAPGAIRAKNAAAVMVTAELPAFARNGSRIDVTVSSLGDARSLQGGTLLPTQLQGADGQIYMLANGPLTIGGFNVSAGGSQSQKNHVNVGRIPRGGVVEKEVPTSLTDGKTVDITLKEPDLTTASRIADAINEKLPEARAQAVDGYTVRVSVPESARGNLIRFLASLENIPVSPDTIARIVINERTGTIVIGSEVKIKPCVIANGALQIRVENTPVVAVPPPFSGNGRPIVVPLKDVSVKDPKAKITAIPATTTVDQLVRALNALGATPRDLIHILQAMHSGGHIAADIEVQ